MRLTADCLPCSLRMCEASNEDFDEDAAEQLRETEEAEDDLMTVMIDSIGYVVRSIAPGASPTPPSLPTMCVVVCCVRCLLLLQLEVHGAAALEPLSAGILPLTMSWLAMRDQPVYRGVALCVVDDILEHCAPAGLAILETAMPHLMEVCQGRWLLPAEVTWERVPLP